MSKAYVLLKMSLNDPKTLTEYVKGNAASIKKYQLRFLVRAGDFECKEGDVRDRHIVAEFDSIEKASAWYNSPEYQAVVPYRWQAGEGDVVLLPGFTGPQVAERPTNPQPRGYWLVWADVLDGSSREAYLKLATPVAEKYGGYYLARGPATEVWEGSASPLQAIFEFPSYEQALAAYESEEYQKAAAFRRAHGARDLAIVKGYDGPQPADG